MPRDCDLCTSIFMGRAIQPVLSSEMKVRITHGGESWQGRRKCERPIATRRPMHIVLRSSHAKGQWSFLHPRHAPFIREWVPSLAKRFHVQLCEWSTNSNHLHLLLRARTRQGLQHFLMVLGSRIAQHITGARKGKPIGKRFFDSIPFSRIVEWGKALVAAKRYVVQNILEASGAISYQPRNHRRTSSKGPP